MIVLYILLALLTLMVMITVHEFGHYVAGKLLKFKINEFSIGFGKAIFSKTSKKTGEKFSIRMIPLGGYCAFEGEDDAGNEKENSFNKQKPWKRLIVLFAGGFFNIIFGFFMTFVMLLSVGYDIPKISKIDTSAANTNYTINAVSGEKEYALQEGDIIWEVKLGALDDTTVSFGKITALGEKTISHYVGKANVGDKITFLIERSGKKMQAEIEVYKDIVVDEETGTPEVYTEDIKDRETGEIIYRKGDPVFYKKIGVLESERYKHTFGEAFIRQFEVATGMGGSVLSALGQMVTFQTSITDISGPFGTIGIMAEGAMQNIGLLLIFIPLISINLGLFNLLPVPALDGSKMVFVTIEWLRRGRPINRKIEGWIHAVGLILLFSFVIIIDIVKMFL